jgi:DNA polymerase III alpha subunit/intein/homing endonuclease
MKVSPHTHAESPLTGSTLQNLIKQAKALGRTHFTYTDHGHMSSALKAYNQAKKAGLKFIPGIEIYFKDTTCTFVVGTPVDRCKYFTTTIYCQDQEAFQALGKIVSRTDMATMELYEEKQQLWRWEDLEKISKFNVQVVLSGVHCMVGKSMLAGKADVGDKIMNRLKGLFGSRLSVAILAEPWLKKFSNVIEIQYDDGTHDSILSTDSVSTDRARYIKALYLVEGFSKHKHIKSKSVGIMTSEVGKDIKKCILHKGFLPLPGGDAALKVNRFLKALASKYGIKVLVTDYAYYAKKEDKIVQTMRLEGNNKLQPNLHMKDSAEVIEYLTNIMKMGAAEAMQIVNNNDEWASQFDNFKLSYKWRLAEVEGNVSALQKVIAIVKENGRMRWDDPKYVARLKEEIDVIHLNGVYDLTPYFLPIRDVLNHYKEQGQLTGPGRGSAGGSLLCYLMGITQIDPFDFDLPFQRFFSMVRIKGKKLPDIDVDLEDRELLVGADGHSGYLYGRWGDKAAQISTRTTIRLKSAILDTNRYFNGKVEDSIAMMSKGFPTPPQGVTDHQFVFGYEDTDDNHIDGLIEVSDELKKYSVERPQEWEIVSKAMGLTRAYSKHASAFVISDVPISDVIPTKDGNITQYEAKEVEEAGLIKYDFLVVKQLKDIRVCLDLIKKKAGRKDLPVTHFPHNGEDTFIWKLPQDGTVYRSIWSGQTETMFQINTTSMRPHVIDMLPENMMDISTLLALVRPGPLDFIDEKTGRNMTEEYMMRRRKESIPDIQKMADLLPATYGILCIKEGSKVKTASGLTDIEAVIPGMLVQTEDGSYQKVLANLDKGYGKTIKIRSDNAEELIVTPDHEVLTNRGWIQAKDLTDKDLIAHKWISDKKIEEGDDRDWLVGLLLADGQISSTATPCISAGTEENAKIVKEIADREFNLNSRIFFNTRCWYVKLSGNKPGIKDSNTLTVYLKSIGIWGLNCYNKVFPLKITKSMVAGFIDGYGSTENQRIRIVNENLSRSLFETLQALRIKSSLFNDDGVWTISFDRSKFNFKLANKNKLIKSNGLKYPRPNWKLPRLDGDRQLFMKGKLKNIPSISERTLRRISDKYDLEYDFESTWSKVLSIGDSDNLQDKIYDLSIENVHSFVVGGCVVHNCFQEQLGTIARDLAGFPAEEAELLRENMAKKKMVELTKMKPAFIEGALKNVSPEIAEGIWDRMVTFGRYGFSVIHAVEYAHITYACMFLKHYYSLEWWAAVLTNATEQEITGKFWPFVKDIVSPPDINLSCDTMAVDYANGKLRSKLGIIRGMGDKTIDPIVEGRQYADIQDYVNKEVAGESLTHKLIHVGVLDSLFPPKSNLLEKLKLYQQAVQNKAYADKVKKAQSEGKKLSALGPKEAIIPEGYIDLHPIKDVAMRKSVLPSLPVDLYALGARYSRVLAPFSNKPSVTSRNGYRTLLLSGEKLRRLDELEVHKIKDDMYVASTCYVLEAKEFPYANNTKRALKMILDADGYVSEKVLWPEYESGNLIYPSTFKKGCIATIFFRKKVGRKDMSVMNIVVET